MQKKYSVATLPSHIHKFTHTLYSHINVSKKQGLYELDSFGSVHRTVADTSVHKNKTLGSTKLEKFPG
jgi:hypothetical protein